MTILEQELRTGAAHYIVSEANGYRSRGTGVIASGSGVLKAGTVLAKLTASGKYVPYDPTPTGDPAAAPTDGSQTAAAILWEGCDATDVDVTRTLTLRDTEVHADVLHWAEGLTDNHKTAALAALAGAGIIAR